MMFSQSGSVQSKILQTSGERERRILRQHPTVRNWLGLSANSLHLVTVSLAKSSRAAGKPSNEVSRSGNMPMSNKGLVIFFRLVSNRVSMFSFDFRTMPSFDAHTIELLAAMTTTTVAFVISRALVRVAPKVRVVSVVRVVPNAPSRAGRKQVEA
jgi:hypothetical protein